MAFGDLKGTLTGAANSVGTTLAISTGGPVTVAVGDLVYAVLGEQAAITSTACSDNLGNVYLPVSAGADAGATVTGRAFYSRVTVAGSLSTVTFTANGGANNAAGVAAVVEGPFQSIPRQTLDPNHTSAQNLTFALGNLRVTPKSNFGATRATISRSSGKYYCEFTINVGSAQDSLAIGLANNSFQFDAGWVQGTSYLGRDNNGVGWGYLNSGFVTINGVNVNAVPGFLQGEVACMAVDVGAGLVWFRRDGGNWNNSGTANPATGVGGINIGVLGTPLYPAVENDLAGDVITANFGQSAYAQTPPSGFGDWDTLLDANPTGIVNDNTTPFTCPVTGTLFQSQEVIMNFLVHSGSVTFTATSPNTKSNQLNTQTILTVGVGRQVVSATTSVAPAWTSSATPSESAYGTTSFKQELGQTLTPGLSPTSDDSFFAPTASVVSGFPITYAVADPLYKYRYVRESGVIGLPFIRIVASGSILPGLLTDADTFFTPNIVGGSKISYAEASPLYRFRRIPESVITVVGTASKPLSPGLISDSDSFFAPSLSLTYNITPSLFTDSDGFFAPIIATSYQIAPSLFVDGDVFSAPVISNTVTPSLFSDSDAFFAPAIAFSALLPGVFVDSDTFFAPALATTYQLTPGLLLDSDVLFAMSVGFGFLNPSLFTDSDNFFAPGISTTKDLTPGLLVDSDVFPASVLGQFLTPSFVIDSDIFAVPTIAGAGEALPQRINDVDIFSAPTVSLSFIPNSTYSVATPLYRYRYLPAAEVFTPRLSIDRIIRPGLLTDVDSFFVPTLPVSVAPYTVQVEASPLVVRSAFIPPMSVTTVIVTIAPQTISAGLFIDTDLFFAPTITASASITPSLLTDQDAFFAPSEGLIIFPGQFVDSDTFFAPSVARGSVDISPSIFNDIDTFFMPSVSLAAAQSIVPNLFSDTDSFFAPTVAAGAVNISPALFIAADGFFAPTLTLFLGPSLFVDSDAFFGPTFRLELTPSQFVDTDIFFAPSLSVSTVNVSPVLFTDSDALFAPVITLAGIQPIVPGRLDDVDSFFSPAVVAGTANITPVLFTDTDTFFAPIFTMSITPNLLLDTDVLFSPIAGPFLSPNLLTDSDAFFTPLLSASITPTLFADADAFFAPSIFFPAPANTILPQSFIDTDLFFGPSVQPGAVNVSPSMFIDGRPLFGLTDNFFEPLLTYDQSIALGMYQDLDALFIPTVHTRPTPGPEQVIGHSLDSDYGIRKSMQRRGRLVIGRR